MLRQTIYTITENMESRNYTANDNGALASLGWLLYRTEKVRADQPMLSRLTVLEGLSKLYLFVEAGGKNSLLHPIHENEAKNKTGKIMSASSRDTHVRIDYDADQLAVVYEHDGEIREITSPVTAFTEAYSRSLRKNKDGQNYLSHKSFEDELEQICDGSCLSSPAEQPGEDETHAPKMSL